MHTFMHACTDFAQTYTQESHRMSALIALRHTHMRAIAYLH